VGIRRIGDIRNENRDGREAGLMRRSWQDESRGEKGDAVVWWV
jgi:hypothetical protein